jgi:hypothetical protein
MSLVALKENPIYKVNHLKDAETIEAIHVFYGSSLQEDDLDELFKRDPQNPAFIDKNTGQPIFNDDELQNIVEKQIPVIFSEQQIHYDDSIGVIKLKIMAEFSNTFSLEEIYLFCMKDEILNPANIYQTLTQNGRLPLTKVRLDQFILNVIYDENGKPIRFNIPDKEVYDYDDILELDINGKQFSMTKVLGQKFFIIANEYPFVSNPFEVDEYDDFIERASRKSLTTLNSHLLLNTGKIVGNNIYLCLARDVYTEARRKGISEKYATRLYYPFLLEKNISSLETLDEQKEKLIESSERLLNENTLETFQSVDLFYDIYKERKTELDYRKTGIRAISLKMLPLYNIKIPLDVIFKLLHATEMSPLIKYNPSQRQENIYRLYADKTAKDGRKIPYLLRPTIFKLMKTIGKTRSVAVYIQYNYRGTDLVVICNFEENGNIGISCDFDVIFPMEEIDELFKGAVNPIIEEVKAYLEQSGYSVALFNNLLAENVEVEKIDYESTIHITKPIKMDEIIGCISSIFIVESKNFKKGIQMRFKRVANFNKMTSREAFIIEQVKQSDGLKGAELIAALMENYGITEQEARELIAKLASELQVERGVRRTEIEIKINPGFKTTVMLNAITSLITIKVENINDINYLYTLPIYLDSFIRLTQDKSSTNVPATKISLLCGADEKEEVVIKDIVSAAESAFLDQEVPKIDGENLDYIDFNEYTEGAQEEGKVKNALDLFFGEDDEQEDEDENEEDEEGERGGTLTKGGLSSDEQSASPSSVSSIDFNEGNIKGLEALNAEPQDSASKSSSSPEEQEPEQDAKPASTASDNSMSSFGSQPVEAPLASTPSSSTSSSSSDNEEVKLVVEEHKEPLAEQAEQVEEPALVAEEQQVSNLKKLVKKTSVKFDLVEPEVKRSQQTNTVKNIDGMKLSIPNPFQTRMEELDPILFNNPKQNGKFTSYSRSCLHSARKQPVILTDGEMKKIEEEQPGFLEKGKANGDILRYGSKPDNQFYYMCPRYWCMKTNSPISEEDAKSGKCGKIIPRTRKEIKPGEYVFEFYDKAEHGSQENYIKHYPGFLEKSKHAEGLCMPCCFKNWNTPGQMERRRQCSQREQSEQDKTKTTGEKAEDDDVLVEERVLEKEKEPFKKAADKEDYIKGPEKVPLGSNRWGYLPMSIQKFLHEVNADCQISKTNTNVKPFHTCLLRHGVETSKNQSFIACIADAKFYAGESKVPSIKDMKELIIQSISLDSFATYQNGDLISIFMDASGVSVGAPVPKKYTTSKLYSKINKRSSNNNSNSSSKTEKELLYFQNVVKAFENFIMFLKDNEVLIDYTYLWDIICKPNPKLFPQGINLVILEISNNDTTNNVEIICPTNHYSNEFYEARKQTLLIIKNGDYYEPIYAYRNEETKIKVAKTFSEYDPHISKTMRAVFKKLIKPLLKNTCVPMSSMPNIYKFKAPINLDTLIELLNKYGYEIENQVVNYQSKVISVVCKSPSGVSGVVPCFPSALNPTYNYVLMTDDSMYTSYEETKTFLQNLSATSNKKIPCLPEFKVTEDEMVVGFITETNQFIQIDEPYPLSEAMDNIKELNGNNYLIAENKTFLSNEVDKERVDYIKKIKLETNFYNVFRNTVRILLNKYENIKLRESIEDNVKNGYMIYNVKLSTIIKQLKDLVNDAIIFSGDYDYNLIGDISTCIVLDGDKCRKNKPLCAFSTGNTCQLILPKMNLLSNLDNEVYYFGKMADELIRYSRINSFIFQPQSYLSFGNLGYNLREDEIIVIQSILNAEYFDGLVPAEINKYAKNNAYDIAEPSLSQNYENRVNLNDAINPSVVAANEDRECVPTTTGKISSLLWKKCFPSNFEELMYDKTVYCGFYMLVDIINKAKGVTLTISQLKNELLEEYVKYLINYGGQIIDILIEEGKKTLGDQVKARTLSFQNFIFTDGYFITNFDIWIMLEKYEIPSMLISSKTLLETKHAKNVFVINGDERSNFIFIISPGLRAENIPKYKIVQSPEKQIFFPIPITKCEDILREAVREKISIEGYLTGYKREKTTKYKLKNPNPKPRVKKMPKLAIVDEEDELEAAVQKEVLGQVIAEVEEVEEVEEEAKEEEPEEVKQNINSDSSLKSRKNVTRVVIKKTKRRRKPGPVKLVIEE